MKDSNIEWTDATWSPWKGCTKVSEGCRNCYAETMSHRNPKVLGIWGPEGKRVVTAESGWEKPLQWNRQAEKEGKRFKVFNSLCDIFEDWTGPMVDSQGNPILKSKMGGWLFDSKPSQFSSALRMDDVRYRLFKLIEATPNLDWLLLTKRPENVCRMTYDSWCPKVPGHVSQNEGDGHRWAWPSNVWIGTSVENQEAADSRILDLIQVPAKVRFLSCEPLLGPVDLGLIGTVPKDISPRYALMQEFLDWVIVGGESGSNARPMNPHWARSLRDQCVSAGVPYFFKQWGEYLPAVEAMEANLMGQHTYIDHEMMVKVGKAKAGRELDGREWNEFPEVTS